MAEFNPFLPQPNIPDWTNAPGRLIDGSGLGEIFSKTATTAVSIFGEAKEKRDQGKIYESAEQAAEEGRVGALAEAAGVPPDLARSMDKATLYRKAFENGNFNETQFYTKMDVWAKEMKSKYPNHRDVIDQQTQRVMGRTPANLELDSVRQQYESQLKAGSEAADKDMKFFETNAEGFTDEEMVLYWNSPPGSEVRNRLKVKSLMVKGERDRQKADFERFSNNTKATAMEAAPIASLGLANLEREMYLGGVSDAGGNLSSLQEALIKIQEGGVTPEEQEQFNAIVEKRKAQFVAGWHQLMSTPGENGMSLADALANNPELLNAQRTKFDKIIADLDDLKSGKMGLFSYNATRAEAALDARTRRVESILGEEAMTGLTAMQKVLPPAVFEAALTNAMQDKGNPIQMYLNDVVKGIAYKEGDIYKGIEKVRGTTDSSLAPELNKAARKELQDTASIAANKDAPIEERQKAFASIMSNPRDFLRSLKDVPDNTGKSSREKFYEWLASPEQAQAAKDLGQEQMYIQALKETGVALAQGNVEQVNATNVNTKYVDIRFNPNTMMAEATLNKSLVKDPDNVAKYLRDVRQGKAPLRGAAVTDIPLEDLDSIKFGMDSVQKLNMIFKGLSIAIKSEKPGISDEDLAKELQQYMGDLKSSYTKSDPWQIKVWEAIKTHVRENTDGTANKRMQKELQGEDFGAVPEGDNDFNVQEDSRSSLGDDTAATILGFVSKAEGADFNTLFGGKKAELETKSVAEVQQLQRAHGKKTGSSATGAYQVMRKTLSDLIDQGVVDPDEPFTEDVQNRIGMALLERRGYNEWKAGKLSTEAFANRLAQEWAALPNAKGKSAYEGVMGNKATVSRAALVRMLENLKA